MKKAFKQGFKENPLQQSLMGMELEPEKKRCAECGKVLTEKDTVYSIAKKGKAQDYCQPCAKRILRPQEEAEVI